MSEKSNPNNHHFVPKCYLKNFLNNNELTVLNVENLKKYKNVNSNPKSLNQICYKYHYYKIENNPKSIYDFSDIDPYFIENEIFSNNLENDYGKIYREITTKKFISISDAKFIIKFLKSLMVRNPYWEKSKESRQENTEAILRQSLIKSPCFFNLDDSKKKYILNYLKELVIKNPDELQYLSFIVRFNKFESYTSEKLMKAMLDCEWILLISENSKYKFNISDNPGFALLNDESVLNSNFELNTKYYLPLSPNYCLILNNHNHDYAYTNKADKKCIKRVIASEEEILNINLNSSVYINNLIIGYDKFNINEVSNRILKSL